MKENSLDDLIKQIGQAFNYPSPDALDDETPDGPVYERMADGTDEPIGNLSENLILFGSDEVRELLPALLIYAVRAGNTDTLENLVSFLSVPPAHQNSYKSLREHAVDCFTPWSKAQKQVVLHWLLFVKNGSADYCTSATIAKATVFWEDLYQCAPPDRRAICKSKKEPRKSKPGGR